MKNLQISLLILTAVACASAQICKWVGTAPVCDPKCEGTYKHYWVKSTCGSGTMCWTGHKHFCCKVASPYSLIYWKGTAPFCGASCSDCDKGHECIIEKHPCGDGAPCASGHKVLCGRKRTTSMAELQELMKLSEYTKAKEEENLNMALLMGGTRQAVEMEGSDPGLVLAYVNYDKIIMDN